MSRTLLLICVAATAPLRAQTTLTLQEAVSRAVTHSPELRVMRAAVAEAQANALVAQQAFRPAASVSTTPGYATGLPIAVLGQVPAIGTIETHKLFYDVAARAEELAARVEIESATTQFELRTRDTAQAAAELSARHAADQALVDAATRRLSSQETVLARTNALRSEGRARDLDVDRAALQVSTARRAALQAQTRLKMDELRLRHLIDWPADQPLHVRAEPPATFPPDNLAVAEKNDPVVRSLNRQTEQLQRATEQQRRVFQPTVATQLQYSRLFDRYSRFYLHFKPDDLSVGATINLPLWTGGRRASAIAKLTAQLQRVTAETQRRQNDIEISVREAEADLQDALAESELAMRAHELAAETRRVSEAMAREGRGEANDVPLAEAALADADEQVATANLHLAMARARILVLRGELP